MTSASDPEHSEQTISTFSGRTTIKALLELRPALERLAGIPQETQLLYRRLRMINGMDVNGMLWTVSRKLALGTWDDGRGRPAESNAVRRINRYSRVIVSTAEPPFRGFFDKVGDHVGQIVGVAEIAARSFFGFTQIKLTNFEARHFGDFVWRTLFSRAPRASDHALVTQATLKFCSLPWAMMHCAGLLTRAMLPTPRYPRLDTSSEDMFNTSTPHPGRVHQV